jgi:hypothetical protein
VAVAGGGSVLAGAVGVPGVAPPGGVFVPVAVGVGVAMLLNFEAMFS